MHGRLFAISGTTTTGEDLIDTLKTAIGDDFDTENLPFVVEKFTLICDSTANFKLNYQTNWSPLYEDVSDSKFKLSTDSYDILAKSLTIQQASVDYYFIAVY